MRPLYNIKCYVSYQIDHQGIFIITCYLSSDNRICKQNFFHFIKQFLLREILYETLSRNDVSE